MRTIAELKDGIFWVGAVDYNVRDFHGYETPHGTSYNSYLIVDEKIALVDTVKKGFGPDLLAHISQITAPEKIDHLIVNHVEPDHAGSTADLLSAAPKARITCSAKGAEGLAKYYGIKDREISVVKTGDTLKLGRKTLQFVAAPMVHWPDSMFTYAVEDRVLLPNDAFGQHLADPLRFADEIGEEYCMEEAAKYYANILMPLGSVIARKIEEVVKLGIAPQIIGPSHGAIWRKDTARIIKAYQQWAVFESKPKVVIVYDTMWESTEKLARRLTETISASGVEVKLYRVHRSDGSQIIRDILDARVVLVGSPTFNADMFWTLGGFLTYLRGLKPKNKKVGIFGSYGWSEAASKAIRKEIETMGLEVLEPPFEVQYAPTPEEFDRLDAFAASVVAAAKAA